MNGETSKTNWPSDRIEAKLTTVTAKLERLETVLIGVPELPDSGFMARIHQQLLTMLKLCEVHSKQIKVLEGQASDGIRITKKTLTLLVGVGMFVGGVVAGFGDRLNIW